MVAFSTLSFFGSTALPTSISVFEELPSSSSMSRSGAASEATPAALQRLVVPPRLFPELDGLKLLIKNSALVSLMRTEELQTVLELHKTWAVLRDPNVAVEIGWSTPIKKHFDLRSGSVIIVDAEGKRWIALPLCRADPEVDLELLVRNPEEAAQLQSLSLVAHPFHLLKLKNVIHMKRLICKPR